MSYDKKYYDCECQDHVLHVTTCADTDHNLCQIGLYKATYHSGGRIKRAVLALLGRDEHAHYILLSTDSVKKLIEQLDSYIFINDNTTGEEHAYYDNNESYKIKYKNGNM